MFGTHPASPLTAAAKSSFDGLKTADYDPIYRFHIPLTPEGAGREMNVETGTDGLVRFVRLGTFDLPEMGQLAVWKLRGYGGGIFVPFRDATAGQPGGTTARAAASWTPSRGLSTACRGPGRRPSSSWTSISPTTRPARTTRRGHAPSPARPTAWPWRSRRRAVLSGWTQSSISTPVQGPGRRCRPRRRTCRRTRIYPRRDGQPSGPGSRPPPAPRRPPLPAGPAAAEVHRRRRRLHGHVPGAVRVPPAILLARSPPTRPPLS